MREIVTTCDRCGKTASRESHEIQHGLATWASVRYHICIDCTKSFEKWLQSGVKQSAKQREVMA